MDFNAENLEISKIKEIEELMKQVSDILEIPTTESNKDTPYRVAKMWVNELFKNRNNNNIEELNKKMKLFPNNYGNNLIIVRDIDFHSVCEHHWLPFSGKVTIGYVPNLKVVGLSKIPRVVKYFSQKPQLQEQLTNEIGEYLADLIHPLALYVKAEATHQCVACRGAESDCSTHTMFRYCYDAFDDSEYYRDWVCRM